MKVPEIAFAVINPVMKGLLHSPLHRVFSDSIMVVNFTGRISGRSYATPVRYVRRGDVVRCYSTTDTQWWRNLRDGAEVALLVGGEEGSYRTEVLENSPEEIAAALRDYFREYPQDAAYHDVRMLASGQPDEDDLLAASQHAVVIDARPITLH